MKKQFSSLLLSLLMLFTLLPVQVWAVEGEGITSPQESQEEVVDPVPQLPKLTVSEDKETVPPKEETPQEPRPLAEDELSFDTTTIESMGKSDAQEVAAAENLQYAGGSGTRADPFQIETAEQLFDISHDPTAYYILTADIDLDGTIYQTLSAGDSSVYYWGVGFYDFSGVFDGQGHTISGLRQGGKGLNPGSHWGLFRRLSGTVRNLGVTDILISVDASYDSNSEVFAGGLAGECRNATIENCFVTGSILMSNTSAKSIAGGLVGSACLSTIKNCYTNCQVNSDKTAGGICGYLNECSMQYCYHIGKIAGTSMQGGIIGESPAGEVDSCYYQADGVPGIGSNDLDSITLCSDSEMKQKATFSGFDFSKIWTMDGSDGYPHLQKNAYFFDGKTDTDSTIIASGECGNNLTWELTSDGTLTISGTGTMYNYSLFGTPWYNLTVKSVIITSDVTTIGNYAFASCRSLTTVSLPETLRTISNSAFFHCSALKSITLPDSVKYIGTSAFSGCVNLSGVTLGTGCKNINGLVFESCSNLEEINIPEGVETIEYSAFENCTNLQEVTIPASMATIDTTAFQNCPCLSDVYYNDYGQYWSYITGADTAFPYSVTIHYKDNIYGNGWCGVNAEWRLENSVLTISGSGAMYDYGYNSLAPWSGGRGQLSSVVIETGITSIGSNAFEFCENLTSISIPQSVRSIGEWAFAWCESLQSIALPSTIATIGDSAFYSCENIPNISLPKNLTSLGARAFSGCSNLTAVEIPNSITKILEETFDGCYSLVRVHFPNSLTEIGDRAFSGCSSLTEIVLPEKLKKLGYAAFYGCEKLTTITIPASVTTLDGFVIFAECPSLEAINVDTQNRVYSSKDGVLFSKSGDLLICYPAQKGKTYRIPDGVIAIGERAFEGNKNLTAIRIPDGLKTIGYAAFASCDNLSTVTIPSSVDLIDGCAFFYCVGLRNLIFNNCTADIGDSAFYNCTSLTSVDFGNRLRSVGMGAFEECSALQSITLPDTITSVGDFAFVNCTSLTSAKLPSSVTEIAYGSFAHCRNLSTVDIPSGVKAIGSSAFADCSSLTSVSLPGSVTSIVYYAFGNCSTLDNISIPKSVKTIGDSAFIGCDSINDVYYRGNKTEWSKISIGYDNFNLTYANIHYAVGLMLNITNYDTIGSDDITVQLKGKRTYTATASDGQYILANSIPAGIYTLSVEKPGYVTYQQEVNYDGSGGLLPSIRLLRPGDINQSGGEADAIDMQRLYEYLTGSYTITDPYLLKVANVNGDEALDVYDLQMLYEMVSAHAANVIKKGDKIGTATIRLDLTTLGINEPESVTCDIFHEIPASYTVKDALEKLGYAISSSGTLDNGFYLSGLSKFNAFSQAQIPAGLKQLLDLDEIKARQPTNYKDSLNEYDYTKSSGWMYSVNDSYPGRGLSSYFLSDGDVLTLRFTLAYGKDIGCNSSTGFGKLPRYCGIWIDGKYIPNHTYQNGKCSICGIAADA